MEQGRPSSHISRRCAARGHAPWRGVLRRHLAWLLLVKFAALALLWVLFFSPPHRTRVDAQAVAHRLMPEEGPHD